MLKERVINALAFCECRRRCTKKKKILSSGAMEERRKIFNDLVVVMFFFQSVLSAMFAYVYFCKLVCRFFSFFQILVGAETE